MLQDLLHACRMLRRHSTVTVTAILTFAVGIGVNMVTFSVLDAAILRPLPYSDPARLVNVYQTGFSVDGTRAPGLLITKGLVGVVRGFSEIFERVEVMRRPSPLSLAEAVDETVALGGFGVGLPALLGVQPQLGRSFDHRDVDTQEAVLLSDGYWKRRYGGDRSVIGRRIRFPDRTYAVVGVMPPTFRHFMGDADAWIAIGERDGSDLAARLRRDLDVEQAQHRLDQLLAREPHGPMPLELQIVPAGWQRSSKLPPGFVSRVPWSTLVSLMAATILVLLIACANVGNLLLARAFDRQGEIATRAALGASRAQVFRQFFVEGLLLAATGGAVALGVAWVGIQLLPSLIPRDLAPLLMGAWTPELNYRVVAFGGVAVMLAGIASSALPALRASRRAARVVSGGATATASRTLRNVRRAFQGLQIALTVVLLVGGGLFGRSLYSMATVQNGFDSRNLVYAQLRLPSHSYQQRERQMLFLDELASQVGILPGISRATLGPSPVSGEGSTSARLIPDGDATRTAVIGARLYNVTPTYFAVAGITLRRGRAFSVADDSSAPKVVIVSQNIAERFWPAADPIGRRLAFFRDERAYTVVGVVPHLKTVSFQSDSGELYFPLAQTAGALPGLLMKVASPLGVPHALRARVQVLDPEVVVARVATVEHLFDEADPLGRSRFFAVVFGMLASTGLLTAAVGLHGLMAVSVGQRRQEFGIRVALGADRPAIFWLVARDAAVPLFGGLLVGLTVAYWLSRGLASQLFQVGSHDPATFWMTGAFIVLVATLALVGPVRRAVDVPPSQALRTE